MTATAIPQATLREEWSVSVTQLWARALSGAVARAQAADPAPAPVRHAR